MSFSRWICWRFAAISRSFASLAILLFVTVTRPLSSCFTSAVRHRASSFSADDSSSGAQRVSRASACRVPVIVPLRSLSAITQIKSNHIPRAAGDNIETHGSFNQSPVNSCKKGSFINPYPRAAGPSGHLSTVYPFRLGARWPCAARSAGPVWACSLPGFAAMARRLRRGIR